MAACLVAMIGLATATTAQPLPNAKHSDPQDRFYPLDGWLPTPGPYRTASGAPGPDYWQQRADYVIDVELDDRDQSISADCRITYHNLSPDPLDYLWVQLDQNRFAPHSLSSQSESAPSLGASTNLRTIETMLFADQFDGGLQIDSVTGSTEQSEAAAGEPMNFLVSDTMMRVDLPQTLQPQQSTVLRIKYRYNIVDATTIRARSGYEFFEEDKNYIYEIAQWFPRMAAYTDYAGWQHHAFLGRGEFTLEMGDYVVNITVPSDMVVAATGTLSNPQEVLKPSWRERLASEAATQPGERKRPTFVITPEEAKDNEASRSGEKSTWRFAAKDVRDFAFAASRKFIWDVLPVAVGDDTVLAMSYYPNEAQPLWAQYSTEAVAHTLEVYGRYSFEYPYPTAISINGPVYGMEYPMICFNGPRPEEDGTYSESTKYALISVVIHEVGHNFFPMIVNSDERRWTWMDEGLNTFLQYLAEQEWDEDYPSRRGPPAKIVPYMRGRSQRPIMTGSESILQFGSNAYAKPATALNILRETVLGRERFDFAFAHYARRWKFKRPTPADFFRTIEDAAGADLDWFWRGWFYSTDHVDIGIENVSLFVIDDGDPDASARRVKEERAAKEDSVTAARNREARLRRRIEWQPGLKDVYNAADYDPDRVEAEDREAYRKFLESLDDDERALLREDTQFYVVTFRNEGGLVMPIPLRIHYQNNTYEDLHLPAEIWRYNGDRVQKLIMTRKPIVRFQIDPREEIADTDADNNDWPPQLKPSRFKLFKDKERKNPMQKAAEAEKKTSQQESSESKDDAEAQP